jgi:hypothetical protein
MYKCFEGQDRRTMSSAYNKQFNFRELRVAGLQVWMFETTFSIIKEEWDK